MGKKSKKQSKSDSESISAISGAVKKNIIGVLLIAVVVIFLLSLFSLAGPVGQYIDTKILGRGFGWGRYLLPVLLIYVTFLYFKRRESGRFWISIIGAVAFFTLFLGIIHIFNPADQMATVAKEAGGGGYLGMATAYPFAKYLSTVGGTVLLVSLWLVSFMLVFDMPIHTLFSWIKLRRQKDESSEGEEETEAEDDTEEAETLEAEQEKNDDYQDNIKSIEFVEGPKHEYEQQETKKTSASNEGGKRNVYSGMHWALPDLNLLERNEKKPKLGNLEENSNIIKRTLHNFGIEVETGGYNIGPTVTQYTFKPAVGVKLSRILALQNDLALALAAHPIRIEAPIPGKSLIGVEVPNKQKAMVRLRSVLENEAFQNRPSNLCIALGEDVNGNVIVGNIEKMPHLMIAGSTGSGKSVCINSILVTLLHQNSPEHLRLILVDPKRVELSPYNNIPHLLTPVIVENAKVVSVLKWAVGEMERRYKLLQESGSRDIRSYNEKVQGNAERTWTEEESDKKSQMETIPYIVIVIDEMADLMAAHGRDVEGLIVRLAQMARAIGIHLVLATQRPSVEVLTGLIKANIITRIAFQVATQIDSRTILDMGGADKLLGNGDMLFSSAESPQPRRIQGVYISDKEVRKVVDFVKKQRDQLPFELDENLSGAFEEQLDSAMGALAGPDTEGEKDDILYDKAKELAIQSGKIATSYLQRKLKIGYGRASRLIDMLEDDGIVGPAEGTKPRIVLVKPGEELNYEDVTDDQQIRDRWQK